jgi:hypothetical protein
MVGKRTALAVYERPDIGTIAASITPLDMAIPERAVARKFFECFSNPYNLWSSIWL